MPRQLDLFDPPPYRVTRLELNRNCNREEPTMNVDDIFASKYLKVADLKGKPRTVVIDTAEELQFRERDGQEKRKIVLTFQHVKQGLILNRTNTFVIRDVYGSQTEAWIGREIILYSDWTFMGDKRVPCIRVRVPETAEAVEDPFPEPPHKLPIKPDPQHSVPSLSPAPRPSKPRPAPRSTGNFVVDDPLADEPPPWEPDR